jgi:hypothetical protein
MWENIYSGVFSVVIGIQTEKRIICSSFRPYQLVQEGRIGSNEGTTSTSRGRSGTAARWSSCRERYPAQIQPVQSPAATGTGPTIDADAAHAARSWLHGPAADAGVPATRACASPAYASAGFPSTCWSGVRCCVSSVDGQLLVACVDNVLSSLVGHVFQILRMMI